MTKLYVVITIILFLGGCVNSKDLVSEEARSEIKPNATIIKVAYNGPKKAFYEQLYRSLLNDGFRISHEKEKFGSISTEGKDVGQSTMLRLHTSVEEINNNISVASFRGQWKGGTGAEVAAQAFSGLVINGDFEQATWGESGRPRRAFAYMYKFADRLRIKLGTNKTKITTQE